MSSKNYDIYKQVLIYSIARQESQFIPAAISFSSAQGIMQIMPFLSFDISKKLNEDYNIYEQFIPSKNIKYGNFHLDTLIGQFDNNPLFCILGFKSFNKINDIGEYIKNKDIEETKEIDQSLQGDKMNDEFFELDSLTENDLIEALNYKVEDNSSKSEYKPQATSAKNETLSIDTSNVNDLSLLISKLLNNKTLEITIKIKD